MIIKAHSIHMRLSINHIQKWYSHITLFAVEFKYSVAGIVLQYL